MKPNSEVALFVLQSHLLGSTFLPSFNKIANFRYLKSNINEQIIRARASRTLNLKQIELILHSMIKS